MEIVPRFVFTQSYLQLCEKSYSLTIIMIKNTTWGGSNTFKETFFRKTFLVPKSRKGHMLDHKRYHHYQDGVWQKNLHIVVSANLSNKFCNFSRNPLVLFIFEDTILRYSSNTLFYIRKNFISATRMKLVKEIRTN